MLFLFNLQTHAQEICIDEMCCYLPQTVSDTFLFYYYNYLMPEEIISDNIGTRLIIDTIYKNNCVNYYPYYPYDFTIIKWSFTGGNISESYQVLPPSITYSEIGMHEVFFKFETASIGGYTGGAIFVIDHLPQSDFSVGSICAGECTSFTDQSQHYPTTWQWEFEGADTPFSTEQNPKDICYAEAGIYTVRLVSSNTAGSDTLLKTIEVIGELPTSPVQTQFSLYEATPTLLQACATNAQTYYWQPAQGLSCTNCPSPVATPKQSTQYTCTMTADGFCTTECSYTVHIKQRQIVVPTAFSPNGDGINDRLIMLEDGTTLQHFAVYNRWGQLVYQTNDISQTWDGSHKSQPAEMGVYVWVAQHQSEQGIKGVSKGSVTIIW